MADTRCANPEYQLDVDVMSLEYILYKAIRSHIQCLKSAIPSFRLNDHAKTIDPTCFSEAVRLLSTFDTLMLLFRQNHPDQKLKEETDFSIALLQFLFLFAQWLTQSIGDGESQLTSEASKRRLRAEALADRGYRRHWMELRVLQEPSQEFLELPDLAAKDYESGISMANNLLPRFLQLSEEIAHNAGDGSEKWMRLARGFMLQGAIERLQLLEEEIQDAADVISWQRIEADLLECFSWGYVEDSSGGTSSEAVKSVLNESGLLLDDAISAEISRRAEVEDRICDLFRVNDSPAANESDPEGRTSNREIPEWTQSQTNAMQELLFTLSSLKEAHPAERAVPVDILRRSTPFSSFLEDLVYFIDNIWSFLHSPGMYGKPVLIQIEEGKLDGLSETEFADFKQRVGL